MTNINKTDVNTLATTRVKGRMDTSNDAGNAPYGAGVGLQCNQAMLLAYPAAPAELNVSASLGLTVEGAALITAVRNLAVAYAPIVRGLYGVAGNYGGVYNAYGIFFVNPIYHTSHYDALATAIAAAPTTEMIGDVETIDVQAYMDRLTNLVINSKENQTVDLRICHGSCHSSCHGSRGRR